MRVVMVAKQKGGVGAITLACELGVSAAAAGQRVVFVDLDPQGTLRGWWNRRTEGMEGEPNPGLAFPPPEALAAALGELRAARVDLCIVDVPPSLHSFFADVMRAADLILLPTRPTTDDLDALAGVLDVVEEVGRPFAFVVTQAPPGKSRLLDDAVPVLAQRGRVAPAIRIRADFPVAAASGRTATEAAPKSKAAEEVAALWKFVAADLARLSRKRAGVKAS
ncbi:ParA family protein [Roseomonas populi]|uniref:ParA family protein n=1 Tax=Roseomonas populi TaxID=3121582 RepID=A0ABT1XCK1_9PROT|nr:ParA family protein [Roseomonas pecuniae]MCR0985860.1 ParA family protein [Roseomonas pecuniae]